MRHRFQNGSFDFPDTKGITNGEAVNQILFSCIPPHRFRVCLGLWPGEQ